MIKKGKKAALELSVNTIVILIIAIVILGLIIGFIKNMFEKTTGQIGDINKEAEKRMLDRIKESPERLVLDPDNIDIRQGQQKDVYFGLRNELDSQKTFVINGNGQIDTQQNPGDWLVKDSVLACFDAFEKPVKLDGKNSNTNDIIFYTNERRSLNPGESFVSKITIKVKGNAKKTTYNCALIIEDPSTANQEYARKDFVINVE
ncbi:MAG: hypothetical protein QW757_03520 [Candidatus Woesearchaeota archaeon]